MAASPVFMGDMHAEAGVTAVTANANLDGTTGAYVTGATGAAGGTIINLARIDSKAAVTANWVRGWKAVGAYRQLVIQQRISNQTKDAITPAFSIALPCYIKLESASYTLIFSTENGDDIGILCEGYDIT